MTALFHFGYVLIKIAALAVMYATLTLGILILIAYAFPESRLAKWMHDRFRFWKGTFYIIALGLFVYSITYWGDHGPGDSSLIPVGHGELIRNGDGVFTYFYTSDYKQRHIYRYTVHKARICAEQDNSMYLIYDLETKELKEFLTQAEYEEYAKVNQLPGSKAFMDFADHYKDYWNGWRGKLLP
jgi:hypothetical protein